MMPALYRLCGWISISVLAGGGGSAPQQQGAGAEAGTVEGREEVDRFLASWADKFKEMKNLEVRFRQEKRLRILKRPLVSQGTIRMAEGKLLCVVNGAGGDVESAMLFEKESLRIHYPKLERLEVYELGAARAPAMAFPLFGQDPRAARKDFEIALERAGKRSRLTLTPKDPEAPIGAMTMVLEDLDVKEVEQVEKSGDRVRMEILEFNAEPKFRPEDLRLEVPPGTREVHPLGSGGKKPGEKT